MPQKRVPYTTPPREVARDNSGIKLPSPLKVTEAVPYGPSFPTNQDSAGIGSGQSSFGEVESVFGKRLGGSPQNGSPPTPGSGQQSSVLKTFQKKGRLASLFGALKPSRTNSKSSLWASQSSISDPTRAESGGQVPQINNPQDTLSNQSSFSENRVKKGLHKFWGIRMSSSGMIVMEKKDEKDKSFISEDVGADVRLARASMVQRKMVKAANWVKSAVQGKRKKRAGATIGVSKYAGKLMMLRKKAKEKLSPNAIVTSILVMKARNAIVKRVGAYRRMHWAIQPIETTKQYCRSIISDIVQDVIHYEKVQKRVLQIKGDERKWPDSYVRTILDKCHDNTLLDLEEKEAEAKNSHPQSLPKNFFAKTENQKKKEEARHHSIELVMTLELMDYPFQTGVVADVYFSSNSQGHVFRTKHINKNKEFFVSLRNSVFTGERIADPDAESFADKQQSLYGGFPPGSSPHVRMTNPHEESIMKPDRQWVPPMLCIDLLTPHVVADDGLAAMEDEGRKDNDMSPVAQPILRLSAFDSILISSLKLGDNIRAFRTGLGDVRYRMNIMIMECIPRLPYTPSQELRAVDSDRALLTECMRTHATKLPPDMVDCVFPKYINVRFPETPFPGAFLGCMPQYDMHRPPFSGLQVQRKQDDINVISNAFLAVLAKHGLKDTEFLALFLSVVKSVKKKSEKAKSLASLEARHRAMVENWRNEREKREVEKERIRRAEREALNRKAAHERELEKMEEEERLASVAKELESYLEENDDKDSDGQESEPEMPRPPAMKTKWIGQNPAANEQSTGHITGQLEDAPLLSSRSSNGVPPSPSSYVEAKSVGTPPSDMDEMEEIPFPDDIPEEEKVRYRTDPVEDDSMKARLLVLSLIAAETITSLSSSYRGLFDLDGQSPQFFTPHTTGGFTSCLSFDHGTPSDLARHAMVTVIHLSEMFREYRNLIVDPVKHAQTYIGKGKPMQFSGAIDKAVLALAGVLSLFVPVLVLSSTDDVKSQYEGIRTNKEDINAKGNGKHVQCILLSRDAMAAHTETSRPFGDVRCDEWIDGDIAHMTPVKALVIEPNQNMNPLVFQNHIDRFNRILNCRETVSHSQEFWVRASFDAILGSKFGYENMTSPLLLKKPVANEYNPGQYASMKMPVLKIEREMKNEIWVPEYFPFKHALHIVTCNRAMNPTYMPKNNLEYSKPMSYLIGYNYKKPHETVYSKGGLSIHDFFSTVGTDNVRFTRVDIDSKVVNAFGRLQYYLRPNQQTYPPKLSIPSALISVDQEDEAPFISSENVMEVVNDEAIEDMLLEAIGDIKKMPAIQPRRHLSAGQIAPIDTRSVDSVLARRTSRRGSVLLPERRNSFRVGVRPSLQGAAGSTTLARRSSQTNLRPNTRGSGSADAPLERSSLKSIDPLNGPPWQRKSVETPMRNTLSHTPIRRPSIDKVSGSALPNRLALPPRPNNRAGSSGRFPSQAGVADSGRSTAKQSTRRNRSMATLLGGSREKKQAGNQIDRSSTGGLMKHLRPISVNTLHVSAIVDYEWPDVPYIDTILNSVVFRTISEYGLLRRLDQVIKNLYRIGIRAQMAIFRWALHDGVDHCFVRTFILSPRQSERGRVSLASNFKYDPTLAPRPRLPSKTPKGKRRMSHSKLRKSSFSEMQPSSILSREVSSLPRIESGKDLIADEREAALQREGTRLKSRISQDVVEEVPIYFGKTVDQLTHEEAMRAAAMSVPIERQQSSESTFLYEDEPRDFSRKNSGAFSYESLSRRGSYEVSLSSYSRRGSYEPSASYEAYSYDGSRSNSRRPSRSFSIFSVASEVEDSEVSHDKEAVTLPQPEYGTVPPSPTSIEGVSHKQRLRSQEFTGGVIDMDLMDLDNDHMKGNVF